jgi:hypothetical protein
MHATDTNTRKKNHDARDDIDDLECPGCGDKGIGLIHASGFITNVLSSANRQKYGLLQT